MSVSASCQVSDEQLIKHCLCVRHMWQYAPGNAAQVADGPCLDAPLLCQAAMLAVCMLGQFGCICLLQTMAGLLIVCPFLPHLAWRTGYGKQDPETMIDVWVTMFSLLMGTTMWLILGSIITTLLIHLNAAHSEYTAKMTALSQYMMENNLPQVRVYALSCLPRCMHQRCSEPSSATDCVWPLSFTATYLLWVLL